MTDKEAEIRLEKKLDLRNRLWEKCVVAFIVVCVAFYANTLLEDYKSSQKEAYYFLQSRLDAISQLRELNSKMHTIQFLLTFEIPEGNDESDKDRWVQLVQYRVYLAEFLHVYNKWGVLFTHNLESQIEGYFMIHQAYAYNQAAFEPKYWGFMVSVSESFNEITRNALREEALDPTSYKKKNIFQLSDWEVKEITNLDAAKNFFILNWEKWKSSHQAEIDNAEPPTLYPEN